MTSTNVEPASTGEITQEDSVQGGAVTSDNSETGSVQSRTLAEEQGLRDCIDLQFRVTEFGDRIGGGSQATVHTGFFQGTSVVLKIYEDKSKVPEWDEMVFNIVAPHVCSSVGYTKVHDGKESVASIMPRHLLDLRKLINSKKGRSASGGPFLYVTAVDLIVQLAIGMNNLHKIGIMHRDIKAENLLVTHVTQNEKLYCVAIADFDGCKSITGTGFWRAPEVLEAASHPEGIGLDFPFTFACDVYSFAVTCSEILTGNLPFPGKLRSEYDGVLSGERPELPADLPQEMASLINRCWQEDPEERPSSIEILESLRRMIQERTDLNPVQTRFDLADPWSDGATSEQPAPERLLQSLKVELEVLAQQNEIQAVRFGNEFIVTYEEYLSTFEQVNIWHLHRFWEKVKVALPMINKGNEFVNSLPNYGSNTVKTLAVFSRLVKPLVEVEGIGPIFQAYVRRFSDDILQSMRDSMIPVESITRFISERLRVCLNSFWASKQACQLRFARTTIMRALRTFFRIQSRQSSDVEAPRDGTLFIASYKTL